MTATRKVLPTCNLCGFPVRSGKTNTGKLIIRCDQCQYEMTFNVPYEKGVETWCRKRVSTRHGMVATYGKGCRCDQCRSAASEHYRRQRQRNKVGAAMRRKRYIDEVRADIVNPNSKYHGTSTGYTAGCRCFWCRKYRSDYMHDYRIRKRKRGKKQKVG